MIKEINLVPNKQEYNDFDISDLQKAPDSYFDSINVMGLLDLADEDILPLVMQKIQHGGKLIASGLDTIKFCRDIVNSQIDIDQASQIINQIKRINSAITLRKTLTDNGFNVIMAGMSNGRYLVEAIKK